MGKPARLDQDQLNVLTGRVSWPTLLQGDEFAALRAQLESLLALRASKGNLDRDEQQQVTQVASAMREDLRKQIRSVSAMDYSAAQRFIKGFAHEVRQPLG
jgi:hypothetical protein